MCIPGSFWVILGAKGQTIGKPGYRSRDCGFEEMLLQGPGELGSNLFFCMSLGEKFEAPLKKSMKSG